MTAVYQGNASFTTSISSGVDQVVEATALTETTTVVALIGQPVDVRPDDHPHRHCVWDREARRADRWSSATAPHPRSERRPDERGRHLEVTDLCRGRSSDHCRHPGDAAFAGSTSGRADPDRRACGDSHRVVTSSPTHDAHGRTVAAPPSSSARRTWTRHPGRSVEFFDGDDLPGTAVIG